MRKIVVFTNVTLDGVMQAPGLPNEDPRGGFMHGGWGAPFGAMQSSAAQESMLGVEVGSLLFGRWTYENFYGFWPKQPANPFTDMLNQAEKYVASNTLTEPLPWQNSILLKGDVAAQLAALKAQPGKDFLVMGSGVLTQRLMQAQLIDLFVLLIHPLVLGSGCRLFAEGGAFTALQLVSARSTPDGVVVVTYRPGSASTPGA